MSQIYPALLLYILIMHPNNTSRIFRGSTLSRRCALPSPLLLRLTFPTLKMVTVAEFTPVETPGPRVKPSTLLEGTPPVIVRALSIGYPLFIAADRILGVLTWTSPDRFQSVLLLTLYILTVRHFERVVTFCMPLTLAVCIAIILNHTQEETASPTLDEVVRVLDSAGRKYHKFISPLTSVSVSGAELLRFVFASLLLSPIYIIISVYCVSLRTIVLAFGIIVLSWHSLWFRVARSVAWRLPTIRWIAFIVTGIDRTVAYSKRQMGNKVPSETLSAALSAAQSRRSSLSYTPRRDVTFTFVVMENQRHWLGIGWTANLLPEERSAWTDPLLNEVCSIDTFKLPIAEGTEMTWKWLDSEWLLDLTNNGAIAVADSEHTTTSSPGTDEGFIYYNSMWSSPSVKSGFSKYTRSRRWVRKATLVTMAAQVSEKLMQLEQSERVPLVERTKPIESEPEREWEHEGLRQRHNI